MRILRREDNKIAGPCWLMIAWVADPAPNNIAMHVITRHGGVFCFHESKNDIDRNGCMVYRPYRDSHSSETTGQGAAFCACIYI